MSSLKRFGIAVLFASIAGFSFAQPAKPSITQISPDNPQGLDDIVVTASAYSGSAPHIRTNWQLDIDTNFINDPNNGETVYREYTFPVDYPLFDSLTRPNDSNTGVTIPNSVVPFDTPINIRVQYVSEGDVASEWSDPLEFTLSSFSNLNTVYEETFESTPVGQIPAGWETANFIPAPIDSFGPGYSSDFFNWSVQEVEFLNTIRYYPGYLGLGDAPNQIPETYETGVPIVENKSMHADSGGYGGGLYVVYVITPEIDLTGVSDVVVAFNSDYLQNQDNIASMEYSLDGGTVSFNGTDSLVDNRMITGTWNPALYYLQEVDIIPNVEGDPSSGIDADFTLFQLADGTDFFFEDYTLARGFVDNVQDMAPFIRPTIEENTDILGFKDNKRFERIRLPGLDNQSSVKFAFMYMGTFSWYWGFDNFRILGSGGSSVSEWSLF